MPSTNDFVRFVRDRTPLRWKQRGRYVLGSANRVFAKKPKYAIIGTGRSGTGFASAYFTKAGLRCSHEAYYTTAGPTLRNTYRHHRTVIDSSWLAVPFLPDPEVIALHQVRHPIKVIASLYKIGFFDPRFRKRNRAFIEFAERYFTPSNDPLESSMRWYIEWNRRCEEITPHRYPVEQMHAYTDRIATWMRLDGGLPKLDVAADTNARLGPLRTGDDLLDKLAAFRDFSELERISTEYGYSLER